MCTKYVTWNQSLETIEMRVWLRTVSGSGWPIDSQIFSSRALFLYQGGYPKLDKDFAGYPPTPPENSILINTLPVAT